MLKDGNAQTRTRIAVKQIRQNVNRTLRAIKKNPRSTLEWMLMLTAEKLHKYSKAGSTKNCKSVGCPRCKRTLGNEKAMAGKLS